MSNIPMISLYEKGDDGKEHLVCRPMNDTEYAQWQKDTTDGAAAAAVQQTAQTNGDTIRGQASAAVDTLETAVAGWAALTAAQKDATLKLAVRVVTKLARLALNKLDSSGA